MAGIGDDIVNPAARMRMRVLQDASTTDGELFEVEATYEPGSQAPLEHLHPAQDEHFEIRAGSMGARIAGEESVFGPSGKPAPRSAPRSSSRPSPT